MQPKFQEIDNVKDIPCIVILLAKHSKISTGTPISWFYSMGVWRHTVPDFWLICLPYQSGQLQTSVSWLILKINTQKCFQNQILIYDTYKYIEKKLKCLKYVRWDILMKKVLKPRGGNATWKISSFSASDPFLSGIFFVILLMGKTWTQRFFQS